MPQKDPDYLRSSSDGKSKSQNQQDAGSNIIRDRKQCNWITKPKNCSKHLDNFGSSTESKPKSTDQQDAANE